MSDFDFSLSDFLSMCDCLSVQICMCVCGLNMCVFVPVVSVPPAGGTEHIPFLPKFYTPLHTTHNQSHD